MAAGPGVGLDGGGAVIKGILGSGADEGDGNALTPGPGANGDAGDYPDILIVDTGRSPGLFDAGQFLPWGDGCPADGFFASVSD